MRAVTEPSWDLARAIAFASGRPLHTETVPLHEALGRTLARDTEALCDLPAFTTSSMDGWAVAGSGPWTVVGSVLAGSMRREPLAKGTAVGIATGAPVPDGATAIIRRERATVQGDTLHGDHVPGADIRPSGEECRAGEVLAPMGTPVGPALLGLLAATGHDRILAARIPRVRLLLLGDELQASGIPDPGMVRDSLGPQLPAWVSRLGGNVAELAWVPDTLDTVRAAIDEAAWDTDLVITTGGTAAGPVDHLHGAIAASDGQILVDRVAVRPGHPMLLGRLDHGRRATLLLGLPGNPQSAVIGLMTLGQPVLNAMLGQSLAQLGSVILEDAAEAPEVESRVIPGTVTHGTFTAASHLGSAMLRGLAASEGFAVIPPGGKQAGDTVSWLPFP